jgi:DHA3 family macrolide efflux protein-like MFS transporter
MGIVGAGLAILVVGLSPQAAFSLGAGGIFLAGFMMPLCMGPIQALVQSTVDPSMQGRVFTIMNSASTLISPISLGIAGPIFDSLGPLIWYQWGGVLAVVIGLVGFASPVILNLGTPEEKVITETVHPQAGMD